jgi:hypothetical protein
MTPTDRTAAIQLLAQILGDNQGNRITHALYTGIVAAFDGALPQPQPEQQPHEEPQ